MDLSIIATLYYSAPYLKEFYERISIEAQKITNDYEIIFVNDGSPDNVLDIALSLHQKDSKVKIIDLSRNFGHHRALLTGLAYANGQLVFLTDCDLEEEPELLGKFYNIIQNSDADVIYGVQISRKGKYFERISGDIFWRVFNLLSSYPVPNNQLASRLMTHKYVAQLVAHRDKEPFFLGLCAITGFKQIPVKVRKCSKGTTTYTLKKKINQVVEAITSFSTTPLVINFYIGSIIVLASTLAGLSLIVRKIFFFNVEIVGWASLIISIWFLGGFTIFSLGLIGIYLSKIFIETKQRPITVIKKIYSI